MPLNTQILRDGKSLNLKWGGFHVAAMVIAASADSGRGPYQDMVSFKTEARGLMERQGSIGITAHDAFKLCDYSVMAATPLNEGSYTLKEAWTFYDNMDGETLALLPGDELVAHRN